MAKKFDPRILKIPTVLSNHSEKKTYETFLDDIFIVFTGSVTKLHMLFDEINKTHPKTKFTMTHTTTDSQWSCDKCTCEPLKSIPFLDTLCTKKTENPQMNTHIF